MTSHDGKSLKTKTRKGNQIMKNRNIQFKATAGVLIPLLLAALRQCLSRHPLRQQPATWCPSMALSRGTLTLSPARSASLQTRGQLRTREPIGSLHRDGGIFSAPLRPDPDLCENNIPYTGTFDWFAANGDEIYGTFEGYLCPTETPGVYDNHETAEVTGGTGRFANATGHFELGGQLDFTTNPPSFVLPWQGVISSVGSTRRH
jgi:hypothetical protein